MSAKTKQRSAAKPRRLAIKTVYVRRRPHFLYPENAEYDTIFAYRRKQDAKSRDRTYGSREQSLCDEGWAAIIGRILPRDQVVTLKIAIELPPKSAARKSA